MYKEFFGLRANPFNVNPDPRYLFLTRHTEEALACLTYGIQSRKGFVLLTGEVGTGKTTLINKLLEWLRLQQVATAFVFNSRMNVPQFLDYMMADFGIPCDSKSKSQILQRLYNWLLDRYRAGETAVLIVDEAQNLSDEVLEEIRMLTNLETFTEKLLQIVLVGQPELEQKLKQPQLRLAQLGFQFRLAHKNNLQQLFRKGFKISQKPDFFQHFVGEILRFINDQHSRLARAVAVEQPVVEPQQHLALQPRLAGDTKIRHHEVEKLRRVQPGIEDERRRHLLHPQPLQQLVDERGFSGAHLAR